MVRFIASCTSARLLERRDGLNLQQRIRVGELADPDECAGRKLALEDLAAQAHKLVAVADIGDEHRHRYEAVERPSARLEDRLHARKDPPRLGLEATHALLGLRVSAGLPRQK